LLIELPLPIYRAALLNNSQGGSHYIYQKKFCNPFPLTLGPIRKNDPLMRRLKRDQKKFRCNHLREKQIHDQLTNSVKNVHWELRAWIWSARREM